MGDMILKKIAQAGKSAKPKNAKVKVQKAKTAVKRLISGGK
ncbi:hypothetical protein FACS189425_10540 [Clostridia bacterium]|nr:hypothetical protein FACS189425_10540 [Clostridia bacterium]